jgi:hypothetical protein
MTFVADEASKAAMCAARSLFDCLQRMGDQASNAVLEVLGDSREMVQERRYPRSPLVFADGRWRAYYHSHALAAAPREHGHFHIFVADRADEGRDAWTHLAALAMDLEGQPLRWFATNRWVTSGPWGHRHALLAEIDCLQAGAGEPLLVQWLVAMIRLYRDDLAVLLDARDDRLSKAMHNAPMEQVLGDRGLYELADIPIDLLHRLQRRLLS